MLGYLILVLEKGVRGFEVIEEGSFPCGQLWVKISGLCGVDLFGPVNHCPGNHLTGNTTHGRTH